MKVIEPLEANFSHDRPMTNLCLIPESILDNLELSPSQIQEGNSLLVFAVALSI